VEFFIRNGDLEDRKSGVEEALYWMKEEGVAVVLHEPFSYNGFRVNAASLVEERQESARRCHDILEEMCEKHENAVGFIAHGYNPFIFHPFFMKHLPFCVHDFIGYFATNHSADRKQALLDHMVREGSVRYEHVIVENVPRKIFAKPKELLKLAKAGADARLNNPGIALCLDLAALSMTYRFQYGGAIYAALESTVSGLNELGSPVYFHISDVIGFKDAVEVGNGSLDFARIIPHVKVGIIEVKSRDETNPVEAVNSYEKIWSIYRQDF